MKNKISAHCFTETGCCYNLYYHRTPLRYINQNKLLIQKVYPLTGQTISLERRTETEIGLFLSCKEIVDSKKPPQIYPQPSHAGSSAVYCSPVSKQIKRRREEQIGEGSRETYMKC